MSPDRRSTGRANAVLVWATVGALLVVPVRYAEAVDPVWGGLTALVVAVAVLPSLVHRSWRATPPWPLLVLVAVPLLVRTVGPGAVLDAVASLARVAGVPLPTAAVALEGSAAGRVVTFVSDFADAVVLATLSLLAVTELQRFTSLRLTVRFASLFVVVATVGLVGLWTVVRWVADRLLATGFLETNGALMAELAATTAAALVAGALFAPVFCRPRSDGDARGIDVNRTRRALGRSEATGDLLVRVLQVGLLGVLAFGVLQRDPRVIVNAAGSLVATELPALVARNYRLTLDRRLVAWISAAALFHAVGTLGPYQTVWWWDEFAHALSASVVAAVGYTTARTLDVRDECLRLPPVFLFAYVLLFVVTVGVVWELFEFALGLLASSLDVAPPLTQAGLDDTVTDLAFDAIGAVVVAAASTPYLNRARASSTATGS